MKTTTFAVAALLASLALPVLAQEGQEPAEPAMRIATRNGPVRNAPYSARMVTERQQSLADGNQIAVRRTAMTYRDNAGRTRHEVADADGQTRIVTIHDPVAGVTWILRPEDRTATKISRPAAMRRKDGKEDIIVKRVLRADGASGPHGEHAQDVRIHVARALEANGAGLRELRARLAPLAAGAVGDMKWAANATTRDLGTRDFNGVKADGKLRSYEIPAGAIGNRNPIVVADETWYAPELKVSVYTRHSDPRSGEILLQLDQLKREEPAPALFAVPSDYTVKEPLVKAQ